MLKEIGYFDSLNVVVFSDIQGSLSNDHGDVNENGKKAIGLDCQNNNFAHGLRFFAHFLTVVARLQRKSA